METDVQRLRSAVAYADAMIRNPESDVALHFWRGWRAYALVELELILRPDGLGLGEGVAGPPGAPSSSPGLRLVR